LLKKCPIACCGALLDLPQHAIRLIPSTGPHNHCPVSTIFLQVPTTTVQSVLSFYRHPQSLSSQYSPSAPWPESQKSLVFNSAGRGLPAFGHLQIQSHCLQQLTAQWQSQAGQICLPWALCKFELSHFCKQRPGCLCGLTLKHGLMHSIIMHI